MGKNERNENFEQLQQERKFPPESGNFLLRNRRWDFKIQRLQEFRKEHSIPIYPSRSPSLQLFMLTNGHSTHTCALDNYKLMQNSLFMIPQAYLWSLEEMHTATEGIYCRFSPGLLAPNQDEKPEQYFPFLFTDSRPHLTLDIQTRKDLEHIFDRLIREVSTPHPEVAVLSSYLTAALHEIQLAMPSQPVTRLSRNDILTREFKQLLHAGSKHWRPVKEYAQRLQVSPNHLNKAVKISSGKGAKQLVTESLILEAKHLLHITGLSISSISFELGIEDSAYFSRLFKRQTGHSPMEYRKQIEKSN